MRAQASYTVEAALIVPIVLWCILLILNQAMTLYEEVTDNTVCSEWWQEFQPAEAFRKTETVKAVLKNYGEE